VPERLLRLRVPEHADCLPIGFKKCPGRDDASTMLSSIPSAHGPVRRDEVFVVYPHRGFMLALGTASLLIGAACLVAAIMILPSDPAGSAGATGIGSFFCLSAWYVLAARECPQITVSERGVMLHRDDPITRMLKRTRVTELAWADIRSIDASIDAETRVMASTRSLVWGSAISFGLVDGSRKRHAVCYTGVTTKRLLTQMRRFAEVGGHRIEW